MALASPQMVKLISSFEEPYLPDADIKFRHHSEGFSYKNQDQSEEQRLFQTIRDYAYRFHITFSKLLQIDIRQFFCESFEKNS